MKESSKKNWIKRTAVVVAVLALIGKVLGFLRQALVAAFYGSNWQTDAFFFASNLPTYFFPGIAGAVATAFVSLYVSEREEKGIDRGDRFASNTITGFMIGAALICVLGAVFCPWIIQLIAPGFEGEQQLLTVQLSRITLCTYILSMACSLLGAVLNSQKFFIRTEIACLMYNFSIITITWLLGASQTVHQLTWIFVVGHVLQFLMMFFFARKVFAYKTEKTTFWADNKTLLFLAIPVVISYGLSSFNGLVDQIIGSTLETGTVSALSYGNSVNSIISGIFVTTLSTVIYPILAESLVKGDLEGFANELTENAMTLFVILIPVSAIFFACGSDVVSVIYERGNFDQSAVEQTSKALLYYAWMYPFLGVTNVFIRGFYANKDTKSPLYYSGIAVFSNAVISVILSKSMGIGGLALGTTISTVLEALLLGVAMQKKMPGIHFKTCIPSLLKSAASLVLMLAAVLVTKHFCGEMGSFYRLAILTVVGGIVYFGALIVMKCKEVKSFTELIRLRVKKKAE